MGRVNAEADSMALLSGTMLHGWILRAHPELCRRAVLVDPVSFRLWEGGEWLFLSFACRPLADFYTSSQLSAPTFCTHHSGIATWQLCSSISSAKNFREWPRALFLNETLV